MGKDRFKKVENACLVGKDLSPLGSPDSTYKLPGTYLHEERKFHCVKETHLCLTNAILQTLGVLPDGGNVYFRRKARSIWNHTDNEFFGENQWHFPNKFPLKLVMQRC